MTESKKIENKKIRVKMSPGDRAFELIAFVIGLLITLIVLYPLFYILISSVSKPFFVDNGSVVWWPVGFNLESYKKAFDIPGFFVAYGNTLFYTIFGVGVNMVLTSLGAYALSKDRFMFRKFFTFFVVFTLWFNAGIIPTYLNIKELGLLNTRSGILIAFAINAYNLIILRSFFESVPKSLEEAAYMDGANNFKIFLKVYLPLSKPALITISMFYAVHRWNGFFWAMNMLRDDSKMPLQVLLKKLIVDRSANEVEASIITANSMSSPLTVIYAVIVVAVVPMILAYPFIQKYFKKGAMIGAVKE